MWKLFAVLALTAASFGLGFFFGQRPVGTLQQTVSDLQQSLKDTSRNILDSTMGIEKDLRRRQGLLDTKSRVVQAKSELLDKKLGEAAKQLGEAAETLEKTTKGAKQDESILAIKALTGRLREVRQELSMGKPVAIKKLDDIQREYVEDFDEPRTKLADFFSVLLAVSSTSRESSPPASVRPGPDPSSTA